MKKLIAISFAVVAFAASAQDTVSTEGLKQNFDKFKSKRGVTIFPEKGEWALGISANPILQYVGNAFSGATSTNQAPTVVSPTFAQNLSGGQGNSIYLKYMKTESTAYRMRVAFNVSSNKTGTPVILANNGTQGIVPSYGENTITSGQTSVMLGLGMEKRRGKDRVKGVYGAEGLLGFSTSKTNYRYAEPLDNATVFPNGRPQSVFSGNSIFAGVRGFVGVEYFFAPKISIGGEVGYTAGISLTGRGTQTNLYFDAANPGAPVEGTIRTNTYVGYVGLGVDSFNASVNLHFYF